MGNMRRDDLLTMYEAAKVLGVHRRWVSRKLKKLGVLPTNVTVAHKRKANVYRFRREEVEAVRKADVTFASIEKTQQAAFKAEAHGSLLERRIDLLEYMLGMRAERLPLDKDQVEARHKKATRLANEPKGRITTRGVVDWSRFFLAVTEEYFGFMESVLGKEDPWLVFISLGERISISFKPEEMHKPDMQAAYGCLEAGRKNLRAVCYARSAGKYGLVGAVERVPVSEEGDVDEAILSIILSREVTAFMRRPSKYQRHAK